MHVGKEMIWDSKDIANNFNAYLVNLKIQSNFGQSREVRWDKCMRNVDHPEMFLSNVDERYI